MSTYIDTQFSVEESDLNPNGYKHIHRRGCKELRDEFVVTAPAPLRTVNDLLAALEGYAASTTVEELHEDLAPCARPLVRALER